MPRCRTAGPCRVGDITASMPWSVAIARVRSACHGSVTTTAVDQRLLFICDSTARHAAQRVAAGADRHHPVGRHAVLGQPDLAGRRLGEPVAGALAADGDDPRRDVVLPQVAGVHQPGGEHRGRPAVELRGAQHDDRVGDPPVVLAGEPPDPAGGDHQHQQDEHHQGHRGLEGQPEHDQTLTCCRCRPTRARRDRPRAARPGRGTASRTRSRARPRGRSAPTRGRRRARRRRRA